MEFLPSLIASLLSTASVVAVGGYLFKTSFERLLDKKMEVFKQQLDISKALHELTLKSQIEFRERQLAEYYGPISAILKRGALLYKVFEKGKLSGIEPTINAVIVDGNNAIVNILLHKSHLVAGSTLPESYVRFLTHVALWSAFRTSKAHISPPTIEEFPEAHYPVDFEADIFRTTEKLKKELVELHARFGISAVHEA